MPECHMNIRSITSLSLCILFITFIRRRVDQNLTNSYRYKTKKIPTTLNIIVQYTPQIYLHSKKRKIMNYDMYYIIFIIIPCVNTQFALIIYWELQEIVYNKVI